jgi:hypothetical protein
MRKKGAQGAVDSGVVDGRHDGILLLAEDS